MKPDRTFKKMGIPMAIALCLALWGCAAPPRTPTPSPPTGESDAATEVPHLPEILPHADLEPMDERQVTLYFRMRDESMLAQETRTLFIPKDKQFVRTLVEALIEGPSTYSMELTGLFISGTRVVDITISGQMATLTLSRAFLGTPVDAPMDWENDPAWRAEVLLRRRLALSSIVNTITEATDLTAVQLLVQFSPDYPAGERIARSYLYEEPTGNPILSPVARDESVILTAHNTAMALLDSFMAKDFVRLHRFVSDRPTEAAFLQEMADISRSLAAYSLSPGTVSPDGTRAVLIAKLDYITPDQIAILSEYPIHLVRERDLWKIPYDTLLSILEAE